MVSAQQTNFLPENASHNDTIFPKSLYGIYQTTQQYLCSNGCAIIVLNIILGLNSFFCIAAIYNIIDIRNAYVLVNYAYCMVIIFIL